MAAAEEELDFAEAELAEMDATSAIALHGEEEDADDLYSEFEDEAPISTEQEGTLALKIEADRLREENHELQKELKELREAYERIEKQNIALKKNISCLFKTARKEIERKDAQLAAATGVAAPTLGASALGRPAVPTQPLDQVRTSGDAHAPPGKRAKQTMRHDGARRETPNNAHPRRPDSHGQRPQHSSREY